MCSSFERDCVGFMIHGLHSECGVLHGVCAISWDGEFLLDSIIPVRTGHVDHLSQTSQGRSFLFRPPKRRLRLAC